MTVCIGKYDLSTTLNLVNNTVDSRITAKHLVVKVPLTRISGLTYHMVLQGEKDCYVLNKDRNGDTLITVGLDINDLRYDELLQVTNYTLFRHYTGLTMGKDSVTPTKNPFLFLVKPAKGPDYYITSADGRDPSVAPTVSRVNKLDGDLKRLIADHDWYYEYSSDSEIYNRGAEQKKDILLRLRQLNVSDPHQEYKRLANLK